MSKQNSILAAVVLVIVAAIVGLQTLKPRHNAVVLSNDAVMSSSTVHTADYAALSQKYPMAQELVQPDGYINTPIVDGKAQPITLGSLVGNKVVFLDFWTYSCINCQRVTPYLNAWYAKYKDYGLEIVGVHTPEFDFEKVLANVQAAVTKFGIQYPVVLDSNYSTWDAYKNNYWPSHYLIDINGLVVDSHIGEGDYAATEQKLQDLLKQRAVALGQDPARIPTGTVDITQKIETQSPETYFGWSRNDYLANGTVHAPGTQTLTLPAHTELNKLYLGGVWDFQQQYAESNGTENTITFTYNAAHVYLVASAKGATAITVMRDGVAVGTFHSDDIDAQGNGTISQARLYKLIDETTPGQHTIKIIIHGKGLDAFTFTFG